MARDADIRIERTRSFLIDALIRLMADKDATRVSVAELTRTAQVNRSTFYLHYVDIYDFLDKESRRMVDGLLDAADGTASGLEPSEVRYLSFFEYVAANHVFFQAMLGPHGYYGFQEYMEQAGRKKYALLIDREVPADAGALNADMVAMYMVSAHMGLIKWWLDGDMIYAPLAMARAVERLSVSGVLAAIGHGEEGWIPK